MHKSTRHRLAPLNENWIEKISQKQDTSKRLKKFILE